MDFKEMNLKFFFLIGLVSVSISVVMTIFARALYNPNPEVIKPLENPSLHRIAWAKDVKESLIAACKVKKISKPNFDIAFINLIQGIDEHQHFVFLRAKIDQLKKKSSNEKADDKANSKDGEKKVTVTTSPEAVFDAMLGEIIKFLFNNEIKINRKILCDYYKIGQSKLHRAITAVKQGRPVGRVGRPEHVPRILKEELAHWIREGLDRDDAPTCEQVRTWIKSRTDIDVSAEWTKRFRNEYGFTLRSAHYVELERTNLKEKLEKHATLWTELIEGFKDARHKLLPINIYNIDETQIQYSDKSVKVFQRKGTKKSPTKSMVKFPHLTLTFCMNALGRLIAPCQILVNEDKMPAEFAEENCGVPLYIHRTANAWQTDVSKMKIKFLIFFTKSY
eukprot:TRINITY_DN58_c0_g1_i2.p1 TRINITY_DN58_c0_g1~~TRINITY_DN58_c0_g1_i2.p1  ORF type:complete len:392 (+),score=59.17 TRINITY_DN58_c0_g1_i2:1046-2221(+)